MTLGSYNHKVIYSSFDQGAFSNFSIDKLLDKLKDSATFQPLPVAVKDDDPALQGLSIFGLKQVPILWQAIYKHILGGKSVEYIAPTGKGKTTCYELIAINLPKSCLVVSPSLPLARTQREKLSKMGLTAAIWREDNFSFKDLPKFVFISPESIFSSYDKLYKFQNAFSLIVVDELSIIYNHKHFRQKMFSLVSLQTIIKNTPCYICSAAFLGLREAEKMLGYQDPAELLRYTEGNALRENLVLSFNRYADKRALRIDGLLPFIKCHYKRGTGIVFVKTRLEVETIANFLAKYLEINVLKYHSEMDGSILNAFMENNSSILVSTTACAYGVDNKRVSWVATYGLPYSINDLVQMAGRAGRKRGSLAFMWCGYSVAEEATYRQKSSQYYTRQRQEEQAEHYKTLMKLINNADICRKMSIEQLITGDHVEPCGVCDICRHGKARAKAIYKLLKRVRLRIARRTNTPKQLILSNSVLKAIAKSQPQNKDELLSIKGLGPARVAKYGYRILEITNSHAL